MHWTEEFFDEYYLKSISPITTEERTQKEVDFVMEHTGVQKESSILDLACGHGRHVLELAQRGFKNVNGLDLTHLYIQMAREKAKQLGVHAQFIEANMRDFEAFNQYNLIFSLFSSLFYFKDKRNLKILRRVYHALQRDGYFIVDHFNPISFLQSESYKDWYLTDDDYIILDKYSHNPISGIITDERLIITPEGQRINRVFHIRDYTVAELRFHLEKIGFEIINVFGNFESEPYHIESPRQIFVTRKPV